MTSPRTPVRDTDPAALYDAPRALALDSRMHRSTRLRLLRRWEEDLLDEQLTAAEGETASRLADVRRAIALVEELDAQGRRYAQQRADPRAPKGAKADESAARPPLPPPPAPAVPYRLAALALLLVVYAAALVGLSVLDAAAIAFGVATVAAVLVALLILMHGARPSHGKDAS